MTISRVLNNSCVVILDDNQKEMILFGNGIGYSKKPKDTVDKSKIDKVFVMQDSNKLNHLAELLNRVPENIIDLSEDLIEYAHETLDAELDESIHISLPDHIVGAVDNYRNGIVLHNTLLLEIQKFYHKEYAVGIEGIRLIQQKLGVTMTDDEAGFIAMHFVNAQSTSENDPTRAIITLVDEMDKIISQYFGERIATIDKSSLIYCRYMTHLKFFAQRVLTKAYFENSNMKMLNTTLRKYTTEYACSKKVCEYIQDKYEYEVNEDEVLYLTVHLVQIMNRKSI